MERNHSIDILRGLGILFVVFGHVCHIYEVRIYIWGFHIPIFFFISGLLFNKNRYSNFFEFCKRKIRTLLLPYTLFYLLTFIYWVLIEKHFRGSEIESWTQICGMFYGTYSLKWMYFNGALWFIPCLFMMEILYWFLSNVHTYKFRIPLLIFSFVVGITLNRLVPWLPFGLCAALLGIVFFGIGDMCKVFFSKKIKLNNRNKWLLLLLIMSLFLCQVLLLPFTGFDLAALQIKNYYSYIPISCLGIILYLLLSLLLEKSVCLEWLGKNSLVIFALQEPVYRLVIFVGTKLTGMYSEIFRCDIICCIVTTVVSIIVIFPFAFCYNRWIHPVIVYK